MRINLLCSCRVFGLLSQDELAGDFSCDPLTRLTTPRKKTVVSLLELGIGCPKDEEK